MSDVFVLPTRQRKRTIKNLVVPLFDDIDADLRNETWARIAGRYAITARAINGVRIGYYAHRVVISRMIGRELLNGEYCDHVNRNPLDNRRCNLRVVTNQQNSQNKSKHKNNKSGHRGVSWHKTANKWEASINVNRRKIYGGTFKQIEDAIKRVKELRRVYNFLGENA